MPNDRLTIFAARPGMKVRCVDPWPPLKYMQTYTIAAGYNTSMALELREHPGRTFSTLRFIPASEPTLAALLAERDAATARAEAAEARCDLFDTQAAAAKVVAANAEAQRDAAIAERDALRDEWEEIAAGITTEQPEVGALWPMVSEINGNLAAARNLFRNEVVAHNRTKAERDRLREALEIVAGYRQCMDNLMSNVDVARVALTSAKEA